MRELGLGTQALGHHHGVADRLEVSVRLSQQLSRLLGLAQMEIRLCQVVADRSQPVSGRSQALKLVAQLDGLGIPSLREHRLELDDAVLRFVARVAGVGEEELDRLAGPPCDVLERGQGRTGPAGFDQEDRGGGHMTFPHLRQAQASLLAGLLDCSNPEVYPR